MTTITLAEFKENIEALVARAERGEAFAVEKDGQALFDLVPRRQDHAQEAYVPIPGGRIEEMQKRMVEFKQERGIDRIFTWIAPNFDEPMTDEAFLNIHEPGK